MEILSHRLGLKAFVFVHVFVYFRGLFVARGDFYIKKDGVLDIDFEMDS